MSISEWLSKRICHRCHKILSRDEMMYSHGVCPKCGYDSDSTICDVRKIIYREHRIVTSQRKWWQFWKNTTTVFYEPKNDFTKDWLLKNNLPLFNIL